mmetsp:Transcript_37794/g.45563  ORF Transcript_37794/g.45563 Transcript_37794/m.45563 type:complete len:80 (-) Transcript_37794:14-253(-)
MEILKLVGTGPRDGECLKEQSDTFVFKICTDAAEASVSLALGHSSESQHWSDRRIHLSQLEIWCGWMLEISMVMNSSGP